MRQITLRDIPEDVERVVRNEAENNGMSLNKAFLSVLRRGAKQNALYECRRRRFGTSDNFGTGSTDELDAVIAELKGFGAGQTTGDMSVARMLAEGRR
jgi:hypothetical protein